jgi:RNA polymerase sigma-70 factor (ECF subfamily)
VQAVHPDARVASNGRGRVDPGPSPAPACTDGELIRRVGESDHEAFELLYRRFARPVLGFALRRLGDTALAEDATQETFAAIWRSAASYRPERGAGRAWLYAVARNAVVNEARKRSAPVAEALELASDDPGPPEQAEAEWVRWRVHSALAELPERQRTLIGLAYWSGLSQSEIATLLDIPLGTVKTRTRAALARLAGLLDQSAR